MQVRAVLPRLNCTRADPLDMNVYPQYLQIAECPSLAPRGRPRDLEIWRQAINYRRVEAADQRLEYHEGLVMRSSISRRGTTVRAKFKLPINSWSRSTVDAEVAKLRNGVIPIIGADKNLRPCLIGSAVALIYRQCRVLVTANHVLTDNANVPLFIFGHDGDSRSLERSFEVSNQHDLAVKLLSSTEADALSRIPFIAEATMRPAAVVGESFYATVVGYPATGAKRKDRRTLETPMEAYSNFATEFIDGKVSVRFNKKEGARGKAGTWICAIRLARVEVRFSASQSQA
jgi:hypothetical protein